MEPSEEESLILTPRPDIAPAGPHLTQKKEIPMHNEIPNYDAPAIPYEDYQLRDLDAVIEEELDRMDPIFD